VVARAASRSPLLERVAAIESAFDAALSAGDVAAAVRAALELEQELTAWSRDTLQSDELDRGRAVLRSMVVRLGEGAEAGGKDPSEVVAPFVEALLGQREAARSVKRWADADAVRDALVALGVEVRDTPDGTTWRLLS
ncbi:MAG: CysS/YqeB C-terminal domain-containing protein, partial [Acidimicrobiales bacterium]